MLYHDTQERQVAFVVSSLRYLRQEFNLGVDSSSKVAHFGKQPRLPHTHPGLILVGHSFGGVLARAAMVAAAQQEDVGEYGCGWVGGLVCVGVGVGVC